jgi:DNA ligase-1
MDGVRAFWNGEKLVSRHSKEFVCPTWFIEELPKGAQLDGELWLGRGKWEDLLGILNSLEGSWNKIKFMVFDMPSVAESYEIRMKKLLQLQFPEHVCVAAVEKCQGNEHLLNRLNEVIKDGGEGLMAIEGQSLYVARRSSSLLKIKVKCS